MTLQPAQGGQRFAPGRATTPLAYVVFCMVTTRPPKTIVEPAALGTVANTDTKLLIYGLFQKGRVLAQDGLVEKSACREVAGRLL